MKKSLQRLFACLFLLLTITGYSFAQGTVTGKVVDANTKEALPGAPVSIKGTGSGTTTDLDGNFTLKVKNTNVTLEISYVGYNTKDLTINLSRDKNIGTILMSSNSTTMSEIVVTSSSVAIDRKTPVAVSSIGSTYIEEKGSSQEFPELLKSTPGVYATKTGGGYGDGRINLRGFNSENVAVLINGIPVNDMENGRVYWSNWAGLTDVTRFMQVQRGLGASKVAVPSIGGTINIQTKSTDVNQGGNVFYGIGNDGYNKLGFTYSTGLTDKKWAVTISGNKIVGNGWADGLKFEGYNYFFNVSKLINSHHTISLTGFGAPQKHGQRSSRQTITRWKNAPEGLKYNYDWGYKNGQEVAVRNNFYHKPQFSLNDYWTINEKSTLSTALYASFGNGGGGSYSTDGTVTFDKFRAGGYNQTDPASTYAPYNLDLVVDTNAMSADGHAKAWLQAAHNNHQWFGLLSTYTHKLSDHVDLMGGLDLRTYTGEHYTEVTDLLGADYVLNNANVNNPGQRSGVGDKISYYDKGRVRWEGLFLQAEYNKNNLSAFVSLSGSNTSFQRTDYFKYLNSDPNQTTPWQNFFGYMTKGGANYNINEHHNLFANIGYFQKAPFDNAVFLNNRNLINQDAKDQKILSYELGYGFRSTNFRANLNLYRTRWNDRTFTYSRTISGQQYFANILGVDALHEGLELDFSFKPTSKLSLSGMASFGNWKWASNVGETQIFDQNQNVVDVLKGVYIKNLKVGDAAQTTAALGLDYNVFEHIKVGLNYNYYGDLYAYFDPLSRRDPTSSKQALKMPTYSLLDVNTRFNFNIGTFKASLFANVNNLFNTEYISDANDAAMLSQASVFFGFGRTYTTGLKINF